MHAWGKEDYSASCTHSLRSCFLNTATGAWFWFEGASGLNIGQKKFFETCHGGGYVRV